MLIVLATADAVLNVAKTIAGIGALIFVHELGHFLVGLRCGVHAEAFSIGFGPVLLKWRGRPRDATRPDQTTEYRLSAIPLGGYVKFLGENPDERGELDPRSFHAATFPRKVLILLAGVTMNLVAAFALFTLTFLIGFEANPPVAGQVVAGMPAWEHGVREGDELVTVNGDRMIDFQDVRQEMFLADEVEVVLRRDGALLPPLRIPTRLGGEGLRQIGVGPGAAPGGGLAFAEGEDGAFWTGAGLRAGDRVLAVDGTAVRNLDEAQKRYGDARREVTWTVDRDGARVDVAVPWRAKRRIGVQFAPDSEEIVVRRDGPGAAAGLASGDRPVSVGDVPVRSASRFAKLVADPANPGPAVVRRGGREITAALPGAAERGAFKDSIAHIGSGALHAQLVDGPGAARDAGLPDDCAVLAIDGKPVATPVEAKQAVLAAADAGRPVVISWRDDDGRDGTTPVTPRDEADVSGIGPMARVATVRETNVLAATALGLDRTARWAGRIWGTLRSICTGGLSGDKLSGPIGISRMTYSQAKSSWGDFLMFLGMISMNLAFLNVLPLPLLDGGQLTVHTVERVRGRPIPQRVLEGVQWAGLVLLLGLMVYVTRNDILHLMSS